MDIPQITIPLYMLRGPVLIVPAPTGVVYENQTNGIAITHRQCEGYLIPVTWDRPLPRVFCPYWWEAGGHLQHMTFGEQRQHRNGDTYWDNTEAIAFEIEAFFERRTTMNPFEALKVDREAKNTEAWYNVKLKFHNSEEWTDAILTWQNCD